ncbi:MAG TPA: basic secretory protein-like protein, partial [Verrucomicrobiota bacterium]|nr:basic secretory protein-like protein [Verrucomicrobiota bacterium]
MKFVLSVAVATTLFLSGIHARSEIKIVTECNPVDEAAPGFEFKTVPSPARNDSATSARFVLVDGRPDSNGGRLEQLHDGLVPSEDDEPAKNFFFAAGTEGGRLLIDLGRPVEIQQIRTYSWHPGDRGPQVYRLYASDGKTPDFNPQPKRGSDPERCGWTLLAQVDTRSKTGENGGQYGVVISHSRGLIGSNQFLLFDMMRTEDRDGFGNTFYSEVDVIDAQGPEPEPIRFAHDQSGRVVLEADGGKYQITFDTTETPDLTAWVNQELAPVVLEWYPRIARMLASDDFDAPRKVFIQMKANMKGVADTAGVRIRCAAPWYRQNLKTEAKGSVVHELVHVVQSYGRTRKRGSDASPNPGWLVEGIADYIRWFQFEPESRGAEITQAGLARARYDGNYRISANFIDWVTRKFGTTVVPKLNAAMRTGEYHPNLWRELTG